jgi:anaerobic ribonucleoside-triphosphate reductase
MERRGSAGAGRKYKKERFNMTGNIAKDTAKVGEGVKFERIRRITGYLVGTTDRFNNAKRAEERDRVKHGI